MKGFNILKTRWSKAATLYSATLILGIFSGGANARLGLFSIFSYVGTDYSQVSVNPNESADLDSEGYRLRLGIQLHRYLDLELVLGGSAESENSVFDAFTANYAGVYAKAYVPLTKHWMGYGVIGGTRVRLEQRIDDTTLSDESTGISYGIGIERYFFYNINGSLDYTVYLSDNDLADVSAFTLGVKWHL